MLFRQFIDDRSKTYTYLLAEAPGSGAILIDPVRDQLAQYLQAVRELGLTLAVAIDTHMHADHVTALGALREETQCATIMGKGTMVGCVSRVVQDGEQIVCGGVALLAVYTPGHTDDSYSFVLQPEAPVAVFSGDSLLIRGSGRTDFQNGDAGRSWDSITGRLFSLPDATLLYPGHDYKGWTASSIGEEKQYNPRLAGKSRAEYIALMNALHLPRPQLMDVAIPANLACGLEGA